MTFFFSHSVRAPRRVHAPHRGLLTAVKNFGYDMNTLEMSTSSCLDQHSPWASIHSRHINGERTARQALTWTLDNGKWNTVSAVRAHTYFYVQLLTEVFTQIYNNSNSIIYFLKSATTCWEPTKQLGTSCSIHGVFWLLRVHKHDLAHSQARWSSGTSPQYMSSSQPDGQAMISRHDPGLMLIVHYRSF